MTVEALDHVNIVTEDLDRAEIFYRELLGLEARPAPSPLTHATARWMYDIGGRAVLHLNSRDAPRLMDRDMSPGPTGALHHIAFRCVGRDVVMARLAAMGLDYGCNEVPSVGLRQVFVTDPDGVLLELNFFAA
ncbi:MAG: VOC family protein [Sphingomonas sp.]|jgi:catechol 2,3-dioxygenase-like lactoylglutathione lyase family enzyme|uniref:VOC family protein n=1 Tax=Sphingomonas sp. TaxID=28214 RepID=UPI0035624230